MNKWRLITIICVISIAVVGFLIWLKSDQQVITTQLQQDSDLRLLTESNHRSDPLLLDQEQVEHRIQASIERRKFADLDTEKLKQAVDKTDVFLVIDRKQVFQKNPINLSEKEKNDGRVFIEYDLYNLESKQVGDPLILKVSELGLRRQGIIEKVTVATNDDIVSWSGYLENGDKNNESFYISQSIQDNYVSGSITTLDGTYTIEAKNGAGWIIPPSSGLPTEDGHSEH